MKILKKKVSWQSVASPEKIGLWKQHISEGRKRYWKSPRGLLKREELRESFSNPVSIEYQKKPKKLTKTFEDILKEFAPWKKKLMFKFSGFPKDEISQVIDIGMWKGYERCKDEKYLTSAVTSYGYWTLIDFLNEEKRSSIVTEISDMDVFTDKAKSADSQARFWLAIEFVRKQLSTSGKETLDLLVKGYNQKEIAEIRGVTPGRVSQTIKNDIRPEIKKVLSYASAL